MEKLKRAFTIRRKKSNDKALVESTSKPHQWNDDERKVREGNCSFQVKYLGYLEVFESRGMAVCEEAMKQLLKHKMRKKSKRAVLYVSGDALRVTEEISKGLIVDQVIEKVSFCAPVRNHSRGFAYICRDATTRRWLCHGFKAVKETGERLSHAVGCAFAVCLEKKQQREKDAVEVTFNDNKTSFTRFGSFKQAPISERWCDPQSVIIPEPIEPKSSSQNATKKNVNSDDQIPETEESNCAENSETSGINTNYGSVPRPRASQTVLERQSSLRIFPKLQEQTTPFKRDYSMRLPDTTVNQINKVTVVKDTISQKSTTSTTNQQKPSTITTTITTTSVATTNNNNNTVKCIRKEEAIFEEKEENPFENDDSFNAIAHNPFISNKTVDDNNNVEKTIIGTNDFFSDPFSAAPINPSVHVVKSEQSKLSNGSNHNKMYSSMRIQASHTNNYGNNFQRALPLNTNNNNPPSSYYASFYSNNSNYHNVNPSLHNNNNNNNNISTNWSPQLLLQSQNDQINNNNNIDLFAKSSQKNNPFDVTWVDMNNITTSNQNNNSTNPFN